MRSRQALCVLAAQVALMPAANAESGDVPGSKDHPMVSRLAGSTITQYNSTRFGQMELPLSDQPMNEKSKRERVEGKTTRILYRLPGASSSHEAFRAYQLELEKAGFKTLYTCAPCGGSWAVYVQTKYGLNMGFSNWDSQRYLAARRDNGGSSAYVMVYAVEWPKGGKVALVQITETAALGGDLVTVTAEAMARDITDVGHVAVYGVYFDTDRAELKPESAPALLEMKKLLTQNPALKVYIVGHTDDAGALSHNLELSQRRAEAVVKALVGQHGIGANRLTARAVGPLAPVASNKTEAGRAKNRRVELVEQ
jgi:outer membrane protein OmpA-like peptidoglycan-associated protein